MEKKWWYERGQMKHNENRPQQWIDILTGKHKGKGEYFGTIPKLEELARKARVSYENEMISKGENVDGYIFAPAGHWIDVGLYDHLGADVRTIGLTVALGAWMFGKRHYKFVPTIFEHLYDSDLTEVPIEDLKHLPDWCVYIEFPKDNPLFSNGIKGFFAGFVRTDETADKEKIEGMPIILDTMDFGLMQLAFLPLNFFNINITNIDDCLTLYMDMKRNNAKDADEDMVAVLRYCKYGNDFLINHKRGTIGDKFPVCDEDLRKMVVGCLNLLIHLCIDDEDHMEESLKDQKYIYTKPLKVTGERKIIASPKPKVILVGQEFEKIHEAAMRHWRNTPTSIRPHKRCGHFKNVRVLAHPNKPGEYTRKRVWIHATFVRGHNYEEKEEGV